MAEPFAQLLDDFVFPITNAHANAFLKWIPASNGPGLSN
jgi:hypothetical protein